MTTITHGPDSPRFDGMTVGELVQKLHRLSSPARESDVNAIAAALTELIAAAEECADDLASYVDTAYSKTDPDYEREVDCVRRLRAAVARVRGE